MSLSINTSPVIPPIHDETRKNTVRSPASIRSSFNNGGESISGKSGKKISITEKIDEISKKLAEVKQQRIDFENKDKKPTKRPSTSSSTTKRSFHHPKLEYVIGEIVHSPYMTKPQEAYPSETFRVQEKLRELKKAGSKLSEIPKDQRPFDMDETKNKFMEEVINYNVSYTLPDEKLPSSASRKSFSVRKSVAVCNPSNEIRSNPGTPMAKSRAASLPDMATMKDRMLQRRSLKSSAKNSPSTLPPVGSYEHQVQRAIFKVQEEFAETLTDLKSKEDVTEIDESKETVNTVEPSHDNQSNDASNQNDASEMYALDDFEQHPTSTPSHPETKSQDQAEEVGYKDDFDDAA